MGTKLLHIGLGKSGSTFLQREIFPEIEKETGIKNFSKSELKELLKKKEIIFHHFCDESNFEKNLPENFIISHEGLSSIDGEFSRISKSFEYIKKNFSSDTTILIVLRNPYELLNSTYLETFRAMNIIKPDEFFLLENNDTVREDGKHNLYKFDYNLLISLYKSYFDKVIIIKYENLNELTFLKEIFNLKDDFIKFLRQKKNKIHNKSISKAGIKIIFFLNRFINLKKSQSVLENYIKPTSNILTKVRNKFLSQFILRYFFQTKFDKIFPYKKYYINKKFIPIDIDKQVEDYNNSNY